jgi:AraC-like DNA-binding protein
MDEPLQEMRSLISRLVEPRSRRGWIEGLTLTSKDAVTEPMGNVAKPTLAVTAQGTKIVVLGEQVFEYRSGQYLIATVDLPITAQTTEASPEKPFLGVGLSLKPQIIAQLLLEISPGPTGSGSAVGMATSDADDPLLDAIVRLLRVCERPDDLAVLGAGIEREIHWRLMTGPQGPTVRQIGLADSVLAHIGRAIRWIQDHYDEIIRIDDLADHVGMSVSSLNRHFRAVTTLSPLQYQKTLRLQEARIKLLASPSDVGAIGHAVGYDSLSQFSREYRRMFGSPPRRDASALRLLTGLA